MLPPPRAPAGVSPTPIGYLDHEVVVMKRRCRKCGELIMLLPVACDRETGEDVVDWCGPRAPTAVCAVVDRQTGSRHLPELMF